MRREMDNQPHGFLKASHVLVDYATNAATVWERVQTAAWLEMKRNGNEDQLRSLDSKMVFCRSGRDLHGGWR
jgi:hypothetical protein